MSAAARDWLARTGYDPVYGARPLKRTIQKDLVQPLAVRLLQGEFRDGDTIDIDTTGEGVLSFSTARLPVA